MLDFDIIMGMAWLFLYHVVLNYIAMAMDLEMLGIDKLEYKGVYKAQPLTIKSSIWAMKLVRRGCSAITSNLQDFSVESLSIELVPMVL